MEFTSFRFPMRFIFIFLLVIASFGVKAQVKGYIGVRGGGHLSSAYLEHTINNSINTITVIPGYHGGVMAKLFTNQTSSFLNAGLQSGLSYVSKGWKQTFDDDRSNEPDYTIHMDYLELPFEAVAYAGKEKTKVFFTLGLYLEYLVDVKKDPYPNLDNLPDGEAFYTYQSERDRKFGYGGKGSVGVWRDFGFGAIHLDGFFTFSLRSFMEHGDLDSDIYDLSNHWTVGFSVAYLIPFGKMDF